MPLAIQPRMKNRLFVLMAAAIVGVLPAACNFCDAEEERAISISSVDSLTLTFGTQSTRMQFGSRVGNRELPPASFEPVFDAIEDPDSPPARSIVLTFDAIESASNQLTIAIAVPEDLTRGDVYTVSGTFIAEPRLSTDPALFGTRDLQGANNAQIAFTRWRYTFPPPVNTVTYRASTATGTIRVTQRSNDYVELEVNLQVTDPVNGPASITGRVQAQTERHTPACLS